MATSGPNYPTTVAESVASSWAFASGGFTPADTGPRTKDNIKVDSDNKLAVTGNSGGGGSTLNSSTLTGSAFGFAIPAGATINGITVEINRNTAAASTAKDVTVQLVKAGVAAGSNLAVTGSFWTTGLQRITYGGIANLWGTTWTDTDVNNSGFGVQIVLSTFKPSKTNIATGIESVRITITYTAGATGSTARVTQVRQAVNRAATY